MRELEVQNLNTSEYFFVALKRAGLKCVWEDPNGMAGQWFVLSARSLASSFSFQPGPRCWPYANTDLNCLIHVNGLKTKRIFQGVTLPQAIIWEDRRLGTFVWTLGEKRLGDFPDPV